MHEKTHVAVSGNIGAGKSSLVRALAQHYDWHPIFEPAENNPYLQDFYKDMHRWAFPTQIYFLRSRFNQAVELQKVTKSIIQDRTIYEDAHIFALNLYQSGFIEERDYQNYLGLYEAMINFAPKPDLLIYLKGSVSTFIERIQNRVNAEHKRRYESTISSSYLTSLNLLYEQWVQHFNTSKVLVVDIDNTDILGNKDNYNQLIHRINQELKTLVL